MSISMNDLLFIHTVVCSLLLLDILVDHLNAGNGNLKCVLLRKCALFRDARCYLHAVITQFLTLFDSIFLMVYFYDYMF